jgi:hypothetical protein
MSSRAALACHARSEGATRRTFAALRVATSMSTERLPVTPGGMSEYDIALGTMAADLEDHAVRDMWWSIDLTDLSMVRPSAWRELEARRLVVPYRRTKRRAYRLTEHGWAAGLTVAGLLDTDDFRDRCGRVSDYFEGRLVAVARRTAMVSVPDWLRMGSHLDGSSTWCAPTCWRICFPIGR